MRLAMMALLVRDYDEAIAYFTQKLGFSLVEDTPMSAEKRWVVVSPGDGARLLPAKAVGEQTKSVGKQFGGRVGFFLHVEDFATTHARYVTAGVRFIEAPRQEAYGTVAVFASTFCVPGKLLTGRSLMPWTCTVVVITVLLSSLASFAVTVMLRSVVSGLSPGLSNTPFWIAAR